MKMLIVPLSFWRILGVWIIVIVAMVSAQERNSDSDYLSTQEDRLIWSPKFVLTRLKPKMPLWSYRSELNNEEEILRHLMQKRTNDEESASPGKRLYVARVGKRALFAARVG